MRPVRTLYRYCVEHAPSLESRLGRHRAAPGTYPFVIFLTHAPFKETLRKASLSSYPSRVLALSSVTSGTPLPGVLSPYPFETKEGPNGTSLAMYPKVGFADQAQGYVNNERRFLSDATCGRFSYSLARCLPKIRGGIFPCSFLVKIISKTTVFGRPLAQLTLAALSLHPLEVEENLERRSPSDVPFGRLSLATYPSVGFAASGP